MCIRDRENPESEDDRVLVFGSAVFDFNSRTVTIDGSELRISTNEFDLLWELASRVGSVVSRDTLVNELRGFEYDGFDRTIDIRISRLRKKLDQFCCPFSIKTIWGQGYLFISDS